MSRLSDILQRAAAKAGDPATAPSATVRPAPSATVPPVPSAMATAGPAEPAWQLEPLPELVDANDPLGALDPLAALDEAQRALETELGTAPEPFGATRSTADDEPVFEEATDYASGPIEDPLLDREGVSPHEPPEPIDPSHTLVRSASHDPVHPTSHPTTTEADAFSDAYQPERSSQHPAPADAEDAPAGDRDVVTAVPRRAGADRRAGRRTPRLATRGADRRAFTLRPGSPAREELAATLDALLEAGRPQSARSWLFTSPGRRDAKTSLVTQLAVALADRGLGEVLLVDADLRDSVLGRIFGLDGYRGVADVLMGWAEWSDVVRPTEVRRMSLAPSGSSVPLRLEHLSEVDWGHLFAQIPSRFRWVVIDTPQACEPEVPAMAAGADGTILVVRLEHSDRYLAQEAMARFQSAGAELWGTVITQTPSAP